jgi:hypothetical protein
MKAIQLPPPVLGLDVRNPEGSLAKGAVRRATNVVLTDDGDFRRSPGQTLRGTLDGAHSLWSGLGVTLVAAGDTLYEATLGTPTTYEAVFTGLPRGEWVEYAVVGADIYFTAGGVLGRYCADGLVRRPGVADLIGFTPTLSATVGSLPPGRYGVAYSLTNDLGDESPLSSIDYIDLPSGGGVLLTNLVTATDVTKVNLFITAPDGRELYRNATLTWNTSASIVDQKLERMAPKKGFAVMPGGTIVRHWHGRLVVAEGGYVIFSDAFDPGVTDPAFGWLAVGSTVTMLEPVAGGLFVGTTRDVRFYRGSGPEDLQMVQASPRGAVAHSGILVPPDYLDARLIGETGLPVAAWLSDVGFTLGLPSGQVVMPQEERIRISVDGRARPALAWNSGVKQIVFSVESMATGVGGSADGTV